MGTGTDCNDDQPSATDISDEEEEGQESQLSDDSHIQGDNVPEVNGADTPEYHAAVRMLNTAAEEPGKLLTRKTGGRHEGITTTSAKRPGM